MNKRTPQPLLRVLSATLVLAVLLLAAGSSTVAAEPSAVAEPSAPTDGISVRLRDRILSQASDLWQVGSTSVRVTPSTAIISTNGAAVTGAYVEVAGRAGWDGIVTAEEIIVILAAGVKGPVVEFAGVVSKVRQGEIEKYWIVNEQLVTTTEAESFIVGEPDAGWLVWVVGVRDEDEVRAYVLVAITNNLAGQAVEFEGPIEQFSANTWQVNGHTINTSGAYVLGVPQIGENAEVRAVQAEDGAVDAQIILVVDPTEEAYVNALVHRIVDSPEGGQTWEVTAFSIAGGVWRAENATVMVDAATYVEERRTTLREGVYAMINGEWLETGKLKAELVRLDRPTPNNQSGALTAPAVSGAGEFWTVGGQRVWTDKPQVQQAFSSAEATGGLRVVVRGLRLGNGLIWVQQAGAAPGGIR